jgi:hypothetical protein
VSTYTSTAELGSLIKEDNAVHVGKASLLELDYKDITNSLAKDATLNVLDQLPALCLESPNCQIRTICWILTWQQGILDLWPVGVGSHGEKEITTFEVPIDSQCILEKLLHVTGASSKGGWQDDPPTKSSGVCINVGCNGICKPRIHLTAKLALAGHDIHQTILLTGGPMVTHILLKELSCLKDMLGLNIGRAWMKAIAIEL